MRRRNAGGQPGLSAFGPGLIAKKAVPPPLFCEKAADKLTPRKCPNVWKPTDTRDLESCQQPVTGNWPDSPRQQQSMRPFPFRSPNASRAQPLEGRHER